MARLIRARKAGSPLIVIPTAPSGAVVLEAVKVWPGSAVYAARLGRRPTLTAPARAGFAILRVGAKKQDSRSNKETDQERCAALKPLDKKCPIQGAAFERGTVGLSGKCGRWDRRSKSRIGKADGAACHENGRVVARMRAVGGVTETGRMLPFCAGFSSQMVLVHRACVRWGAGAWLVHRGGGVPSPVPGWVMSMDRSLRNGDLYAAERLIGQRAVLDHAVLLLVSLGREISVR